MPCSKNTLLHAGTGQFGVAVGKQNGSLLAWAVGDASLTTLQQAKDTLRKGSIIHIRQAHGSLALTSALLTQGPRSSERGFLGFVASAGLDKDFKSWSPASNKVRSQIVDM